MTSVAHRAPLDTTELAQRHRAELLGLEALPAGARVGLRAPHRGAPPPGRRVAPSAALAPPADRTPPIGLRTLPGAPADPDPGAAELAFIMFTSGSTGTPKGVMLSRRAVLGTDI